MRNLSFLYFVAMFLLGTFATAFFLAPTYMPRIREWKARRLTEQSEVYKSDVLANTNGLMAVGIRQAKVAMLLAPDDIDIVRNYVELISQADPPKAITEWKMLLQHSRATIEDREKLIRHCLSVARSQRNDFGRNSRALAISVANLQLQELIDETEWGALADNMLLQAEFLAEAGKPQESLKVVTKLLEQKGEDLPSITFLYAKLATHLGDTKHLGEAGRLLADLAQRPDEIGIEAIRHMTLIHTILPLAPQGLDRCNGLLQANPKSKPIDYLRIHALRFDSAEQDHEKEIVLQECAELFDLEDNRQLEIYCRWLGRLHAFPRIMEELPPARARVDEELFKMRMNALAALGRRDDIKNELANAPAIPPRWRLIISARMHALSGDFHRATEDLDQLLEELGKDTRLLLSTCRYLESAGDLRSLCHLLEQLADIPGTRRYALEKLLEHQASSATLSDVRAWISKLRLIHVDDPRLHNAELYFELLDSNTSRHKIAKIAEEAGDLLANHTERGFHVTAALAYLLNEEPDKALIALGDLSDWQTWREARPAWVAICAQVLRRNQDTQTAMRLEAGISTENMDLAERRALASLFPENFPSSRNDR